ncbi:MAG: GNAT family N-acetyltransferase [Caulobacteraceae bacterium]|nr:GNAT family N-acetyltransferase [Caulobacteraceae bacterium]
MKIDIVRPSQLSKTDAAAWTALQGVDPALDSPFFAPGWAEAVERAQGGERSGTRIALIEDDSGQRAYFPLRLRGPTAMPAGAPMCDYQGLVAAPEFSLDARRLVGALGVDRLDFSQMLADQPVFSRYLRGQETSRAVDLSGGYQAYAAERKAAGSGLIKDLDKRRRKAEREVGPVVFEAYSRSQSAFEKLVAWKRELMRATHQTDIFEAGWPLRLLSEMFASRDPDFGGVLFTLSIGDRVAAAHLHLRGRHTIHAWIIGHDSAADRFSPGLLLFQDILKWMDTTPYAYLDFGGGDYRFKQQFANAGRQIGHGFVGRPSPATLIRAAEYGLRQAAEQMRLGRMSDLPGKAMRRLDLWRGLN